MSTVPEYARGSWMATGIIPEHVGIPNEEVEAT